MGNGLICAYITGIHIESIARHAPRDICRKQSEFFRLLSSILSADYFAINMLLIIYNLRCS